MAWLPSPLLEVPPVRNGAPIVRQPNADTRRDLVACQCPFVTVCDEPATEVAWQLDPLRWVPRGLRSRWARLLVVDKLLAQKDQAWAPIRFGLTDD